MAKRKKISATKKPRHREKPEKRAVATRPIPIVGIGASAGGLQALEEFLRNVPPRSGLAFVIIQHLDPTRKGLLIELLQRCTAMPVKQIVDALPVKPDCVYVIPPDRDLSILRGVLYLLEPMSPRGQRLPIDVFFKSLADDRHQHAIGVVLSGMGSDGTEGLRAIKANAGATFVQDPKSATFDAMPTSAIAAKLADVVAPAKDLAARILEFTRSRPTIEPGSAYPLADQSNDLEKVLLVLRQFTGRDFSLYKRNTIARRVERRMGLHKIVKLGDYLHYLRENPQEATILFKEILIGVTSFFRDPPVWEQLQSEVLQPLLESHHRGGVIRAWVAGCSTGQEAYSLAIAFSELAEKCKLTHPPKLQIFATDLDEDAIAKARRATYAPTIASEISEDRLNRCFIREDNGFRVRREVREMVIFAPHDITSDPPFTRLDLLICRNLLIYFSAELQKRLLPLFFYSIKPGGVLMLGSAESTGPAIDHFVPLPGGSRLFRRADDQSLSRVSHLPAGHTRSFTANERSSESTSVMSTSVPNVQSLAEGLLLQRFSPAAVLTNPNGDILYINGKTGKYLEPAAGKANWNLFAMARDGLADPLAKAMREATRLKLPVSIGRITIGPKSDRHTVDVTVNPISTPNALSDLLMIVFKDVAAEPEPVAHSSTSKEKRSTAEHAGSELVQARETISSLREQLQSILEERQSANEELQSSNEELQSMNEELTTSKEEMQSMNEELQTINQELQAKVDELLRTSSDMKNLLNSTDIAILFLDDALNVRRFTPPVVSIIKLIPADVGRPVSDIVSDLEYPALVNDAKDVLRTLVFKETQVTTRDGRWFAVKILPYRTHDNRIDGVVITFADITVAKELEGKLRRSQSQARERTDALSPQPPGDAPAPEEIQRKASPGKPENHNTRKS